MADAAGTQPAARGPTVTALPLLLEASLPHRVAQPLVAWDSVSGLLALACSAPAGNNTQVAVLDPRLPEDYCVLTPGVSHEQVLQLQWSPAGVQRWLLALSAGGRLHTWALSPQEPQAQHPVPLQACTADRWHSHSCIELPHDAVHCSWLAPPSLYAWPRQATPLALQQQQQRQQGVVGRFLPNEPAPRPNGDPPLHWVRPGLPLLASVTAAGQMQLSWQVLAPGGGPAALAWRHSGHIYVGHSGVWQAEAVATSDGALRVLLAVGRQGGHCHILHVDGDPTAAAPGGEAKTETYPLTSIPMADMWLLAVAFNPGRAGTAFVCVIQDAANDVLQCCAYQQQGADSRRWLVAGAFQEPLPSGGAEPSCRLAFTPDGSMLALMPLAGDHIAAVHVVDGSTQQHLFTLAHSGPLTAAVFSPNGTALSTLATAGSGSILTLAAATTDLPPPGAADASVRCAEYADLLALRLLWAMACETSSWDVCAALGAMARAHGDGWRWRALAAVDGVVHAHMRATRLHYGTVWNRIKYELLRGVAGRDAALLRVDLLSRCVLEALESSCAATVLQDHALVHRSERGTQLAARSDASQLALHGPWLAWMRDFATLLLRIVKTWALQRHAAGSGASDEALAAIDAKPLLRLLPDAYFMRHLQQVLIAYWVVGGGSGRSQAADKPLYLQYDVLSKAFKLLARAVRDEEQAALQGGTQGEDAAAAVALADAAAASFQAPRLHYYRTEGGVRWQAVHQLVDSERSLKELPTIDDAAIEAALAELQLLDPAAAASSNFLRQLLGAAPCALPQQLPPLYEEEVVDEAAVQVLRLRRWAAERDAAFGILPDALKWEGKVDAVSAARIAWSDGRLLASADGLFATTALDGQQYSEDATANVFYGAWSECSPLLGSMWRQAKALNSE